jgi:signal transduction histidine kinase
MAGDDLQSKQGGEVRSDADEAHASELARANEALKRGASRLAQAGTAEAVLGSFLLEAVAVSGASLGSLLERGQNTDFHLRCWAHGGEKSTVHRGDGLTQEARHQAVERADLALMECVAEGEVVAKPIGERERLLYAEAFGYGHERGQGIIWHFPYRVEGQVKGCLLLAFSERTAPTLNDTGLTLVLALVLALQDSLALRSVHLAQQASLKAQQAALQEERNRMARELHDTLAQSFTGVTTNLEAARALLPADSRAQFHIQQASEQAREGLHEAWRGVRALRSRSLQDSDLIGALQKMVSNCDHVEPPRVRLAVEGQPSPLTAEVEADLLRVGQEALINAVRHAEAQNVAVELEFSPRQVLLRVSDDGKGFAPQVFDETGGFGLIGVRERIERLGGRLNLHSAPGEGTQLEAQVPIAEEPEEEL